MVIKILMLVVFFAVLIAVGVMSRKSAKNVDGFVLGGRSVGPWLTAFAYGTSYFSAVIFIGYAGQFGWKFGVASTWIGIGNAIIGSLLAWVILGRRTRLMTHKLNSSTMPEFFAKRFDSKGLRIGSSIIIFIFLIPYTASLYNGLSRLFEMAFHIDYKYCIIAMAVLTGIYVIVGGYMATAINDFIQGIIMLIGIVAVILAVLNVNGGFMGSMIELSKVAGDFPEYNGAYTSFVGPLPMDLLGVVILTSLGTWGLPQMVQKFYAIKHEDAIKKGTIISTFFAIVVAGGCYFLGGFGRLFLTQDQVSAMGFDAIVPTMLATLPDILIAVVVILVLSASMSTLSSLVLTSSSTLTLDFISGTIVKNMGEKAKLIWLRVLVVVFIAISSIIALIQYSSNVTFIAQLMGVSWGALAGAFLAPFLFSLYWKKATKASCWACFIFGSGIMVANMLFRDSFPALLKSPINCGAFAMLAGFIIVPVISLISKKPSDSLVEEAFSSYERKVTVKSKTVLEEEEE
ncbi:MAG: sodium:solute symporter [Clostridiales bacterium]|nr:sodium:solute symporter [Clostridiales bacterium]